MCGAVKILVYNWLSFPAELVVHCGAGILKDPKEVYYTMKEPRKIAVVFFWKKYIFKYTGLEVFMPD